MVPSPPFPKNIEAKVVFLKPEEGGRKTPIFSGYRPTFLFEGNHWDAIIHFEGNEFIADGKSVNLYFSFVHPENHIGKLFPGKEFQLWDGRIIAKGVVTKFFNLE